MQKGLMLENKTGSICFFSHSSSLSGAERSLLDLITLLISRGVVCSVVLPGEGPLENELKRLGVLVKNVKSMSYWCDFEVEPECYEQLWHTIQNELLEMIAFVREVSPNVIYTQTIVNPFGAMVAEYLNLPYFIALREYGELDHDLKFCFGFKKSMEAIYSSSDYVFSISNSVAEVVLGHNHLNENVKVNYSKVDIPEKYKNRHYGAIHEKVKIGIFGFIVDGKNQLDVIKAVLVLLKDGYDLELYVVGLYLDEYFNFLLNIISKTHYADKIIFTGYTLNPLELMEQMDIVVSCSKNEGLGRTLFEAILMKIPIIYANSGGPKEIYKDREHGLAYDLYNENDLADKIVQTIKHPEETYTRVEKAFDYVSKRFTYESYCQPVLDALNDVRHSPPKRKEKHVTNFIMSNLPLQSLIENKLGDVFLYINKGEGFYGKNFIQFPVLKNHEIQEFIFDLTDQLDIKSLRLDPLNDSCIIKIKKLALIQHDHTEINLIPSIYTNALSEMNEVLYFSTNDSQIFFNNSQNDLFQTSKNLILQIKYLSHGKEALSACLEQYKHDQNKLFTQLLVCKNDCKIVFFGASSALEKKFETLNTLGIIPDYICDSATNKHGTYMHSYEIHSPKKLLNEDKQFLIFITSSYANEIKFQLKQYKNVSVIGDISNIE